MEPVPLKSWVILAACAVATMLNDISGAVLNLDLPSAARDLEASAGQGQLILLLGKLALGALLLAGGGLGDRFGRKTVILAGIGIVAAASVLSGLAPTARLMAAGRALDGIGNAMIGPLALALCVLIFPAEMRARVIGLFLGLAGTGVVVGPLLAGAMIQLGGWRLGFVPPLALSLLGGAALAALVPVPPVPARRPRLDLPGMALSAVGLTAVVLGFVLAGNQGWMHRVPLGLIVVGAAGLAVFAWWELRRAESPLVDSRLLVSREVLAAMLAGLLMSLVLNGTVFPLLYFMQRVQGSSPLGAVMRLLPLIAAALLAAPVAGDMAVRRGRRLVIAIGLLLVAAGSGLLIDLTPHSPYAEMLAGLVLIGAGAMTVITPGADLIMATTGRDQAGSAAALNAAVIQVGGAIGIGVIAAAFARAGEQSFLARMAELGYSAAQADTYMEMLREAVRETTLHQIPRLPEVSAQTQAVLMDAYARAAAAGVSRGFAIAGAVALATLPVVLLGMPRRRPPAGG